jgi:pseudouridine-5'-monophosphatase
MKISHRPVAVIYDLDGVLLDTEPFYTQVTQEIVGRFGKTFDWSVKSQMIGRPSLDSARYLVTALELPITPEEYLRERQGRLEVLFEASPPTRGAERFTRSLARLGVPQAVATSSEQRLFELKTKRHASWFSIFGAIVTGDDPRVGAGKPAPDIFLRAAEDLAIAPADCLVFEDAPAGVQAARRAGMQVIALPDPAMDRARYRDATLVISSFEEVSPVDLRLG